MEKVSAWLYIAWSAYMYMYNDYMYVQYMWWATQCRFHHVLSFLSLTLFSCLLSLSLMSQILLSLTELVMGGEDCSPKQRLLRNMGAHTVVLDLLQVPYGKRDQRMTKIISHAHRFLQFFCQGDDQNQMILYRNMNSLLQSGNHVSHMTIT